MRAGTGRHAGTRPTGLSASGKNIYEAKVRSESGFPSRGERPPTLLQGTLMGPFSKYCLRPSSLAAPKGTGCGGPGDMFVQHPGPRPVSRSLR